MAHEPKENGSCCSFHGTDYVDEHHQPKTLTFEQNMLIDTADRIDEIVESLNEFADWAEGEGYNAIHNKIIEGRGRIMSAADAARQYADGTLTRRD